MQPIISGTTTERIIRTALVTLLFGGYSAWSLWDGYVGYPQANVETALRDKIGVTDATLPPIRDDLSARSPEDVEIGATQAQVIQRLGDPGLVHEGSLYYFGPAGYVAIKLQGGQVSEAAWVEGPAHGPSSIGFQKLIGFVMLPLGLGFLIHFGRVVITRATLTDEGLKVGGRSRVPWDAIKELREAGTGRYDVIFRHGDREGIVRLDDYILAKTPAMVEAIRERKGFAQSPPQ
jgi:hypothetical protein